MIPPRILQQLFPNGLEQPKAGVGPEPSSMENMPMTGGMQGLQDFQQAQQAGLMGPQPTQQQEIMQDLGNMYGMNEDEVMYQMQGL